MLRRLAYSCEHCVCLESKAKKVANRRWRSFQPEEPENIIVPIHADHASTAAVSSISLLRVHYKASPIRMFVGKVFVRTCFEDD